MSYPTHRQTLEEFVSEEAYLVHLGQVRWPDGPGCPKCRDRDGTRFPTGTARFRAAPPTFSWFSRCYLRDPADAETTLTQRNIHRFEAGSPYSELVRQTAFVVQLWTTEGSQFAGLVEDVDTGKQIKFLREQELLDFLRERFAQTQQSGEQKEGTDERKDGRR